MRQGELKVCEAGDGWAAALDNALSALDRKLTKARPVRGGRGRA